MATAPKSMEQLALRIDLRSAMLEADVSLPGTARGLVLFAHGSGSSRFSPRNRQVAQQLNEAQLATVLADLLTPAEEAIDERTRQLRFDIQLLADRLVDLGSSAISTVRSRKYDMSKSSGVRKWPERRHEAHQRCRGHGRSPTQVLLRNL